MKASSKQKTPKAPINPFNAIEQRPALKKLKSFTTHINELKKLTQLATPVLSIQGKWQIASFQHGILCIAVENATLATKLRYMQQQYIKQLKDIPAFIGLSQFKIIIDHKPEPKTAVHQSIPSMSNDTQILLKEAATLFLDPEITQILYRMARKK